MISKTDPTILIYLDGNIHVKAYTRLCDLLDFIELASGVERIAMTTTTKKLSADERRRLLGILTARFATHTNRHQGIEWAAVQAKLEDRVDKLWSLNEMERTGGEPDVVAHHETAGEYLFVDCSAESPAGRRSVCYDRDALEARKEHRRKPAPLIWLPKWASSS